MEQSVELMIDDKNMIVMKLLHYFITEKNYNPIILQGVENEIWLENLDEDYKIIRIVSSYIHNDEQFRFDMFKTKRIMRKIKKKTLSLKMNTLSIFLDLGENVNLGDNITKDVDCLKILEEQDFKNSQIVTNTFPDLTKKLKYSEEGLQLFAKITNDINVHNKTDAEKMDEVFKQRVPYVTYFLIGFCMLLYFFPILFGSYDYVIANFSIFPRAIRAGEYYRLLTGAFLHGSLVHLLFNCYALFVIGSQLENFLGRTKYLFVYLFSAVTASLTSMLFLGNGVSIGASGAIFGLMGSLVYFGYHYRVYLGNIMKSQIIPLILFNLLLGFVLPGIDNFAHIGGLIGGSLITISLGIKYKSSAFEKINGWIITFIYLSFLIYLGFVYSV